MTRSLSIIIPTRERATYLEHSIRTCLTSSRIDLEVLVLDNASTDLTPQVIESIKDSRVSSHRSERRLSMRDNFERGLNLARGEVICFIGDDDGLMPHAPDQAMYLFDQYGVDAVSAARAHYFWPDLLTPRKNTALLPRRTGVSVLNSRDSLKSLLEHLDYYRLPCLYHGFVKKSVIDTIRSKHNRFFLSSQVDIYSAIALSAEGMRYALSRSPLIINGGSKRSNGASHFGGGDQKEKGLWKVEDDIGFLPGFEDSLTLGALIIESALRYCGEHNSMPLIDLFDLDHIERTLCSESARRSAVGRSLESIQQAMRSMKVSVSTPVPLDKPKTSTRLKYLINAYLQTKPIDMGRVKISNVFDAAQYLQDLLAQGRTGLFNEPWDQVIAAARLSKG